MLAQPRSTITLRRLMDEGAVVICNLAKGRLGEGTSHLLGALLTTTIAQAALSRADVPVDERRVFYLYADEFQSFATDSFALILSEARKYALMLTVAHQYLEQLPDKLRAAVFGNVGSMLACRTGNYHLD
jgi:type IV secretory pathway TraG/TraD family ATPase VirD4